MRVVKIGRISAVVVADVATVLRGGGVVAFPTESSYGLAADPRNAAAVRKVFRIKQRPSSKALPLVAASTDAVMGSCSIVGVANALAAKWPAALTLVLPVRKRAKLDAVSTPVKGKMYKTIAVRVPKHAWARAVAGAAGGLATSTSANVSGDAAIHDPAEIVRAFSKAKYGPDLLLDAGVLPKRAASTIVRVVSERSVDPGSRAGMTGQQSGRIEVLRQGAVRIRGTV